MGFLDSLFGRRAAVITDPGQLQEALFAAARAGDGRQLEALCRANRDAVVANFPGWQKVPAPLRDNPQAVQGYVAALVAIAQTFAHRLESPELLQRLTGSPGNNPIVRWQEGLDRAAALVGDCRYPEAGELLANLLIDARGLRGSGVDRYLPITLGRLGECYFQAGTAARAVAPLEQALDLCVRHDDADGVAAYLGNLYEVHRYLGQAEPAAGYVARLADALAARGRADEARRYRRQAEIVRAGEPLNRIVAVVEGQRYELDDVPPLGNRGAEFVFERNRITLQTAVAATRRGGQLGGADRWDDALEAFRAAAVADPFDPDCHYQAGLTLLYLRRYADAVEAYEATEERAPGWFHCRADRWLAQQLALGNLDHETFLATVALEDGALPPQQKADLAARALTRTPELAAVHLQHGKSLGQQGRSDEAQAAYRRGLACAGDPDTRTRLLVELGVLVTGPAERDALLREARDLGGNLVAAATATLVLRASAAPAAS